MNEPGDLIGRLEASGLPASIIQHLTSCVRAGRRHRWHDALEDRFDQVVENTITIIEAACRNTGCDPDSLVRDADFDPNDLDPNRLDAAIAELRGINHLARSPGFTEIKLLRAQAGTRTADIVATRHGERYALDVACSSAGACRAADALSEYVLSIVQQKNQQLLSTCREESCRYRGVVFVMNSPLALRWGYQTLYKDELIKAYEALGQPSDFHICIITGLYARVSEGSEHFFEGSDDIVYPSWPCG